MDMLGQADRTSTNTYSAYDLIKYDSVGQLLWAERFDGPISFTSVRHPVLFDSGNLFMTGYIYTNASDFLTMKLVIGDTAPVADASATKPLVISPNNRDALVVLDGSPSFDADGDAISFEWLAGQTRVGSQVRMPITLAVGTHIFALRVNDGSGSDSETVVVRVVTACDAVTGLIAGVDQTTLLNRYKRQLLSNLRLACLLFDRGDFQAGSAQLRRFQTYVRLHVQVTTPSIAEQLITEAGTILSAVDPHARRKPR
jgi:hypothetical protein